MSKDVVGIFMYFINIRQQNSMPNYMFYPYYWNHQHTDRDFKTAIDILLQE